MFAQLFEAAGDGIGHRTIGIIVNREQNVRVSQPFADLFTTMTQHHDDLFRARTAQLFDANLDHGPIAEWQERLEGAHPAGTPGGEDDSTNISHAMKGELFRGRWFPKFKAVAVGIHDPGKIAKLRFLNLWIDLDAFSTKSVD